MFGDPATLVGRERRCAVYLPLSRGQDNISFGVVSSHRPLSEVSVIIPLCVVPFLAIYIYIYVMSLSIHVYIYIYYIYVYIYIYIYIYIDRYSYTGGHPRLHPPDAGHAPNH